MKKIYRNGLFLLCLLMLCCLAGCQKEDPNEGKSRYSIYYLNREETKIAEFAYYTDTQEPMQLLGELLEILAQTPANAGYHETISNFLITAPPSADPDLLRGGGICLLPADLRRGIQSHYRFRVSLVELSVLCPVLRGAGGFGGADALPQGIGADCRAGRSCGRGGRRAGRNLSTVFH